MLATLRNYHLIRVGVDHEVGVVRNDDDLPPMLRGAELLYEFLKDRLWIQIFLRLVDDERPHVLRINGQI